MSRDEGPERKRRFRVGRERGDPERDLDDEVRFHLERKAEALQRQGLGAEEARREAARRFGDVDRVKEGMRKMTKKKEARMRSLQWRDGLSGDVRFAFRQLVGNPVFSLVTLVTLALGIGANTAIFSVVDGILFRSLPYPAPDQLVVLWTDVTRRGGPDDEWFSWANFHDVREQAASLESLAAWGGQNPVLTGRGESRQLLAVQISRGMFERVLRVEPPLGRSFQPEDHEPDAPAVALLSDGLWRDVFGADRDVLGTSLLLNDQPVTVVGVMPADFRPPFVPGAELWLPTRMELTAAQEVRGGFSWRTVGRLAPDAGIDRLATELEEMGRRLEAEHPESNSGMGFRAVPLRDELVAEARTGLLVLLGAVGFVLLVACVNVASLLMARATARSSELAVRSALGAGRRRIVQQLLVESALLAAIGGIAGVGVARFGTDLLVSLAPSGTPRLDEVGVDGRILVFTAAITVLAGVVFGLLPALRAARADLHTNLREGGRGQGRTLGSIRLRAGLVVGQVALALVLLVGAGLLVRSFRNLSTQDLGFRPADVLTMQVNLPFSRYPDAETRIEAYDRLEAALGAVPGVTSVGLTSTVPLTGFNGDVSFNVEGRPLPPPGQEDATWFRRVTPTYFTTMGIPIVEGRAFRATDRLGAPRVLIVNETLARSFFPQESAVGKRINLGSPDDPTWREIVGVARDVRNFGIREGSRYATYSPFAQTTSGSVWPVVRTALPPERVLPSIREAVGEIDPSLAVARVQPMTEIVRSAIAPDRFVATLLSLFAGLALLLAVVGLYGVVSYGVGARIRELGVRMALGAGGGSIGSLVVTRSLRLVALGVVFGLVGAFLLTRLMGGLLFGVSPTDPVTFAGVAALLALFASVASLIPAVRAARVDPAEVLRAD